MSDAAPQRLQQVREQLAKRELDCLLVTNLTNVRYLSGFTGTNGLLAISADKSVLLTDFRYLMQAAEQTHAYEVRDGGSEPRKALTALLTELGGDGRVGFDDAHMTVAQYERIKKELGGSPKLVGASGIVERMRRVKDDSELAHIATAAQIADRIYERLVADGLVGHTEEEVAWRIESLAREFGAEGVSFPPIVASGAHGALPHAEPRNVEIRRGHLVVVDLGCKVAGYCSDATRTFVTGQPSDHQQEIYELVLSAQKAALEAVTAGIKGSEVDAVARDMITAAGHGERFGHSLGHGVGLEVHETPTLAARSKDELEIGNVVTVEPGVYLDGEFGVRIEDLVVVTAAGPQVLSGFEKGLVEVK